jgi:AbrB family looped-hinge helix DNA binding protein
MHTHTTANGQIVIPASIRRKLGITKGTRVLIDVDEAAQKIVLTPITREYIHSLRGKYKGKDLLKALMAEKER